MKRALYAVLDTKAHDLAGDINAIHIFKHPTAAVRWFSDLVLNKETTVGRHPEDYQLVELATLNDANEIQTERWHYDEDQTKINVTYDVIITAMQVLAANAPSPSPELVK